MAVSMKNVDPAFQGVGQKVYPIDLKNELCCVVEGLLSNLELLMLPISTCCIFPYINL